MSKKTLRPTYSEEAGVRAFEESLRKQGELEARMRLKRQVPKDATHDMALWAAVLAGVGAVGAAIIQFKKPKKSDSGFGNDPIVNEARRLGII